MCLLFLSWTTDGEFRFRRRGFFRRTTTGTTDRYKGLRDRLLFIHRQKNEPPLLNVEGIFPTAEPQPQQRLKSLYEQIGVKKVVDEVRLKQIPLFTVDNVIIGDENMTLPVDYPETFDNQTDEETGIGVQPYVMQNVYIAPVSYTHLDVYKRQH